MFVSFQGPKGVVEPKCHCTITAASPVSSGPEGNMASVQDAGTGATYDWSINGGSITTGTGTNEVTWTAGDAGTA